MADLRGGGADVKSRSRLGRLIGAEVAVSLVMIGVGIGLGSGIWSGASSATTLPAATDASPSSAPGHGPLGGLKAGDYERSITLDLVAPSSTIKWGYEAGLTPQGCVYGLSTKPSHGTIGEGTTRVVFKWTVDNSVSFPDGGCAFRASIVDFGVRVDREPPTPGGAGFGGRWGKDPGRSPNVSCTEHQLIQGTSRCHVDNADKVSFTWSANARVVSTKKRLHR
jgi:hypothetical protein